MQLIASVFMMTILGTFSPLSFAAAMHHTPAIQHEHLSLSQFWARASIGMAPNSGAYGQISTAADDRLIAAETPVAAVTEIHEHRHANGVMQMREIPGGLLLTAGSTVTMAPGGYHLMLIGLKSPLVEGSNIPIKLTFEKAGTIELEIPVRAMQSQSSAQHSGMKGHGH